MKAAWFAGGLLVGAALVVAGLVAVWVYGDHDRQEFTW